MDNAFIFLTLAGLVLVGIVVYCVKNSLSVRDILDFTDVPVPDESPLEGLYSSEKGGYYAAEESPLPTPTIEPTFSPHLNGNGQVHIQASTLGDVIAASDPAPVVEPKKPVKATKKRVTKPKAKTTQPIPAKAPAKRHARAKKTPGTK
jgi:hypothetical protein